MAGRALLRACHAKWDAYLASQHQWHWVPYLELIESTTYCGDKFGVLP